MKSWVWIVAALAACSTPVLGQFEGRTALAYDWHSQGVSRDAAFSLGMTTVWRSSEPGFIASLQGHTWDLVILDLPGQEVVDKVTVLALFEQHLARGGRLMVNYPELDQWPELQALLGVRTLRDLNEPAFLIYAPPPGNPLGALGPLLGGTHDLWSDNGDELEPTSGGFVVGRFGSPTGPPASVIRADRLAVTNGLDWDSHLSGAFPLARGEILYLLGCRPDLDPAGSLDIFDFLEFQNLWARQSRLANLDFDEAFTVFDFLEFQRDFVAGCP